MTATPGPAVDVADANSYLSSPVAVTAPQPESVPVSEEPEIASAKAAPVSAPPASAVPTIGEVAATRRMYGAHAPLRTPAVADPDSEQNRQILQTMVTKALSRTSEPKPAATK